MIRSVIYLVVFMGLLSTNGCEDPAVIEPDVDAEIKNEMEINNIPSVVACVVKGNSIVWEGTYGYADIAASEPATDQTLYAMMSVSKLFIAVAVMQLWEKNLVDLDADINDYLPFEIRNPYYPDEKITSRMLLTHRSSLARPEDEDAIPDFWHFYRAGEVPLLKDWLPEFIIPGGSNYRSNVWKTYPPGEKELYSNIATSVLALIVEEISGMDFRDYCQENILDPLEMNNSSYRLTDVNEDLLATPYYDDSGYPFYPYVLRHYPTGSLFSNLTDFSHFMTAFLNYGEYNGKRILEKSTTEKMFEIQNPASGVSFLWWHCLGDCIGHDGGGTGYRTLVQWYIESGRGIIILSNIVNSSVYPGRIYELVRYQSTKF